MNHPSLLLAFVIALLRSPLRGSSRLSWPAAAVCLALSFATPLHAAPLSGTRSIGPTGDYVSLTGAIADVQAVGNGLNGPLVLELQASYVSNAETYPLTIPTLNGASAVNTLTIRPASGATGLTISSASTTAATVDLNGAQFVTFDGRPGGAGSHPGSGGGTASQLTIENTSAAGVAIRFINDASNNTARYTTLRGVNTSGSGTVVFSTTTGSYGNDNNRFEHCDIRDGASAPRIGIFALGSTATIAQSNSGNIIADCNIFNFFSNTADSRGILLGAGNTEWSLTGNSFFQTASRDVSANRVWAIDILNISGSSFNLTGNFIGGSAPGASGPAWTTTSTTFSSFTGIHLFVGVAAPSNVQGNTIANIVSTGVGSSAVPGAWCGIHLQEGRVNVGTVAGNTIGSGSGTNSISVTSTLGGGTSHGIASECTDQVVIANNTVGGITVNGSSTSISASLTGILVTAGANTISDNNVGSATTPNSLNAGTSSTSGQQHLTGIHVTSTGGSVITRNTVANLNNNSLATTNGSAQTRGIATTAGVNTITGNFVFNISTTSRNPSTTGSQSLYGIMATSTSPGQTVSQNTIHSLANLAPAQTVAVTGIYFSGPTSGTNTIARNFVHSLSISSSVSSSLSGLSFAVGTFTAQDNFVRVGLNAAGVSTAEASTVNGILDSGSDAGRNFYHNSVFVGGTQTSGTSSSFAINSLGTGNNRTFQNNIWCNARTNSGAAGKNYAARYNGAGANPLGLTAGGNLLLASGLGGVLGYFNTDQTSLAAWQAATGQDATSAVADPLFTAPTGDASTIDLHLQAGNPAEGGGIQITDALSGMPAIVQDDFDGQARANLSPIDIGADAGNFTSSGDIYAPAIRYSPLARGAVVNRLFTNWASITDSTGSGVAGGANAPRLYFKKSTDTDAFNVANDSSGNGWKYVTASGGGPYTFTLDYSLLNGGGATVGEIIQYFVVAQDNVNNLGSNPAGATASTLPRVQNVNGHGAVSSFAIVPALSETVTVGVGGTYPTLSGAGGLFAALNAGVLTSDIVAIITSDLTENGSISMNECSTNHYPPVFGVFIRADGATMRTIAGSSANGLITLNGADRVKIDGSFGGTGRYITLRNTSTGTSANSIRFINDACNNTVQNCSIEGAGRGSTLGVVSFSTGVITGNDNNLITNCRVRDLSSSPGVPNVLIGSSGSLSFLANSDNSISNNELFNFNTTAIAIGPAGNESWTLSGNSIFELNAATGNPLTGISIQGEGLNLVTGNDIHDLMGTGAQSYGIAFAGGSTTMISRNRITAFGLNANTTNVQGIYAGGISGSTLTIVNNQVTLSPAVSSSKALYGIFDNGRGVLNVFNNSVVLGGTESGTRSSWASARFLPSTHTTRANLFLNFRTGGTGGHYAAGSETTGGSYTSSHNVYSGTGATSSHFMELSSTSGTTVPMDFSMWQGLIGDLNSQAGVAGTSPFNPAMFVDAANGDLHLTPGGNALVNALAPPIVGVTHDFDGDPRSTTSPTIGSDEFVALTPYQQWAIANNVSTDPGALGGANLQAFAFGTAPGSSDALVYTGAFAGGGTITATGMPVIAFDPVNGSEFRALYVRRKDHAAAGLAYMPRFSANLTSWVDSAAPPVVLADDGVNQIIGVPFPGLISGQEARFFRVTVTLTP